MPRARTIILGGPLLLAIVTALSLWSVSRVAAEKKNEMYIGSIGEPVTLNPLQAADSAAASVTGVIFNGLLRYNAELEIEGDLADGWVLGQRSTFFFASPGDAVQAAANMESQLVDRARFHLQRYQVDGDRLVLELSLPGVADSRELAELFGEARPLTVRTLSVTAPKPLGDALEVFAADRSGARIVRTWANGNLGEICFLGEEAPVADALKTFLAARLGEGAVIEPVTAPPFLAEPEVTFHLREGVRWHDGAPFNSHDVKFTYEAIMDDRVASPRKSDYELVLSLEAPDPRTVRVVYRRPFSPALESWMMSVLPAHLLENVAPDQWPLTFNRAPVGTGPFKFAEWKTNQFVRVARNDDYFRGRPHLEGIVFRTLPDPLTLRLAFETRQVDFWGVDPWAVGSFRNDERFILFSAPSNSYNYVGWNLRRPLFQDLRVRRALAQAVNVGQMIRYVLYGYGEQSTGIFTPEMWFFNRDVQPLAYDPAKARELLAEAGWRPGADGILEKDGARFSFTLLTNNGNAVRSDIATLVQADLKAVGIEVKVEMYEWAVFLKNFVNKGEFDAVVLGWALGQGFDQFQIWHSSQTEPERLNMIGYKSKQADRLLEAVREEFDRDKITAMCHELQQLIYNDQPYLFLFVPQGTSVMWKDAFRVRRPGPDGTWIDEPVTMTKSGWSHYLEWFYRPEYAKEALN
ncbi:MAG: peptide-binding protein [Chthoniobacterales bacterium]|nr:peptide-binding protein [Chthoniobacterales bacterium]